MMFYLSMDSDPFIVRELNPDQHGPARSCEVVKSSRHVAGLYPVGFRGTWRVRGPEGEIRTEYGWKPLCEGGTT